ncbi:Ig-like domain-containing protein [Butyrivibrio sp. AE3004]|uniref:Ig-like domain-containing protein n=1 Tax=Butyrivibrio sp. AE3004 TaxID=1506994 RepID=UPI0004942768|nr:Ig-like domain-containing protein [Butyrivibrio sp. AE3004]
MKRAGIILLEIALAASFMRQDVRAVDYSGSASYTEIADHVDAEENTNSNVHEDGTENEKKNDNPNDAGNESNEQTVTEQVSEVINDDTETADKQQNSEDESESKSESNSENDKNVSEAEDQNNSGNENHNDVVNTDIDEKEAAQNTDDCSDKNTQNKNNAHGAENEAQDGENGHETENTVDDNKTLNDNDAKETDNEAQVESSAESAVSDGNAGLDKNASDEPEDFVSDPFSYETEADGYLFTISAKENIIPNGSSVKVKAVDDTNINEKIEEKTGKDILASRIFDIEIFDEDGEKVEPQNGDVHINVRLSEEGIIEQENYEGFTDIKMIHLHEDEISDLEAKVWREDSAIALPVDRDEETIVAEDDIDPNTLGLKPGTLTTRKLMASPMDKEYYQDITLDFDTDSFSEFAIVNVLKYTYKESVSGNLTTYDLTGMKSELDSDFRNVVQGALNKAWAVTKKDTSKYYKVIVPAGTYHKTGDTSRALRLGSNTTLQLDGVTIINDYDGIMVTTQKLEDGKGAYSDYQNIVISGGCFDGEGNNLSTSLIKLAHMTGLTIENVTFEDSASPHMLEIAACKNVKVKNCTFKDHRHTEGELEAFQIDVQKEGAMTYVMDPVDDDYPCENVEVSGCTFNNLYRGFGSHCALTGDFYFEKIKVNGCTFNDIRNTAIMCTLWKDSTISNNVFTNVGRGVDTTTYTWYTHAPTKKKNKNVDCLSYNANFSITGNQITLGGNDRDASSKVGLLLSGYYSDYSGDEFPQGLYTVSGFDVSGNVINGYSDWSSFSEDNVYAGIYTVYSAGNSLSGNTLRQSRYGILVRGGSEASNISGNTFSGERDASIAVKDGGIVYDMSGNKLTMDCPFGIYVDDTASCNGNCEVDAYTVGVGEAVSTRTSKFSIFTNDLSNRVAGEYSSDKKSVAKTTKAGKLKGVKKGKTGITASWVRGNGTVNVTFTANVKKAPTKVKIPKKKTLKKGATYQLNPKVNKGSHCDKYKFKSLNKKIAKVSSTGLVTARKKGMATIMVTSYNGVSSTITIKVK